MVEEKVRVELIVHGSVQMVSFRYRVSDIADDLGIVGRIINKPDKTVNIIAEGEKSKIQGFVERIKIRPLSSEQIKELQEKGEFVPPQPLAKVEKVEGGENYLTYTGKYHKFEIIPEEHEKELVNSLRTASHLIDRLRTDMYYNFQTLNNNYIQSLEKIRNKQGDVAMNNINFKKTKLENKEVIKRNGEKEPFIKEKIVVSAVKAGAPVSIARDIAKQVEEHPEDELKTKWIRQYVIKKLKTHNSDWPEHYINYDEGVKRLKKYHP